MKRLNLYTLFGTLTVAMVFCLMTLAGCGIIGGRDARDWGNWVITTPATCLIEGIETRTCQNNPEQIETRPIAALGHNLGNWSLTTAPTCVAEGVETRNCTRPGCSHIVTRLVASLGGHSFGVWSVTTPATCTTAGVETRSCTRPNCSQSETRAIDATGHAFDVQTRNEQTRKSAATCIEPATYYYSCATCGVVSDKYYFTYSAPLAHEFGEWAVTTPATCTTAGVETRNCTRPGCTHYETRAIVATGHTFDVQTRNEQTRKSAATCTDSATYWYSCATCGVVSDKYYFTYGAPLAHEFGEWAVTTAPTCLAEGIETRNCANCSHSETRPVNALGHEFGDWTVTTPATCTTAGIETRNCANCSHSETRPIPMLGHTYTDQTPSHRRSDATYTDPATYWYLCAVCGKASTTFFFQHGDPLEHKFTERIRDVSTLRYPATKYLPATYWYSCKCGEVSDEYYFTYGYPLDDEDIEG